MKTLSQLVKLGYEKATASPVFIQPSHLIATGITQLSGKTTTLEAIIKRSGKRAVVFKTKVGETGFTEGTLIPPYFKERSDWQYVSSLFEATMKEKMRFERAWIIRICENTDGHLLEVSTNLDRILATERLSELSKNVYTTLQAYFRLILPQLQYAKFSRTLTLHDGINIMDLERYSVEIQSLVIRSVLEIVLNEFKDVIVVVPEMWKFDPEGRGSPCKQAIEEFIRQGATNGNYLLIDSQDMAGVDKQPLKQVSTWILGLQMEMNEVKHTLAQIPLPAKSKPKPDEIMTLKVGEFILATPQKTVKIYVQPAWMDDATAIKIAKGELDVSSVKKPEAGIVQPVGLQTPALSDFEAQRWYARVSRDLVEMRTDFFDKIEAVKSNVEARLESLAQEVKKVPSTDDIVSRVLQKMPQTQVGSSELRQELRKIVDQRIKELPSMSGSVIYEVAPLEKLQRDFQEAVRAQVMQEVSSLNEEQKKMFKFIEALQRNTNVTEIMSKCLFLESGGSRQRVNDEINQMISTGLIRKDAGNKLFPALKTRLTTLMQPHNATEQEIEAVYNHILMEMLK